ncbi:uncharacterized protein LOC124137333 [Haliotis rufescens]|uniref:uncharacterized protein LOC124137333 n=1 Tax=Haliotis rufescens TaxID=6454 RepID=UPI00201FB13C|nr:uncharacterized protein LOC124137333 [Haliotis rufescens]
MPVHDLHKPLEDWAKKWNNISDGDFTNGDVRLEVETKKLRIRTTDPKFCTKPSLATGSHSPSGVLFKSKYMNRTNATQEHTFIMERQTEATVTTSLSNGFTRNGNVGIQISVPDDVSNATGSFGSDVSVETEDENTVKHSVGWSVTSKVNALPGKTTVAVLRIKEKTYDFTFQAKVTLKGRVLVRIMDGSGTVLRVMENDLATILDEDDEFKQTPGVAVDTGSRKVTWDVTGSLNFRFGVSQEVEVSYEDEQKK